jgi:dTDP-4-amino-4,6-dideoxygalactose transaminase
MIPPVDPRASYLAHRAEIDQAIGRVLASGRYILGEEVAAFEAAFAAYLGAGGAAGVACGTDALHLALRACGVRAGDAVATSAYTATATLAAIEMAEALPVLVDVDASTLTMDPESLEEALSHEASRQIRAVVPVHLFGQPADMPALLEIARAHDLAVVEDCAQAAGASISGRRVGTWGDAAAFSFYPTKNLSALGDGGAVVARDPDVIRRVGRLREYGWTQRYVSETPGFNSRLDELQAAVLRVKLRYLDAENDRRREIAGAYGRLNAREDRVGAGWTPPAERPDVAAVHPQYVVRTRHREALERHLHAHEIGTLVHYPVPLHRQPAYRGRLPLLVSLHRTEEAARRVLSLPCFPELTREALAAVTRTLALWQAESTSVPSQTLYPNP